MKWRLLLVFLAVLKWPAAHAIERHSLIVSETSDTLTYSQKKRLCYGIGLGGTALVHAGLYQLWYKGYPSTPFHFFNDNHEWLQMDKLGHSFSSYYLGLSGLEAAKRIGVPANKRWQWAIFGSIFQDPIELWDGISEAWGASAGDLMANTFGTVLSAGQEALWHEQKVKMKYSYSPSEFAVIRPNMLGSNLPERMLKDYNAQTYWLTYSPFNKTKLRGLGFAFGYGANGMVGGDDNIWEDAKGQFYDRSDIVRYRQYYLGLDYDLTKIRTNNPHIKTLLFVLNCII
jgi:uncharacterized protein YfiM (DUF2279 family)